MKQKSIDKADSYKVFLVVKKINDYMKKINSERFR